MSSAMRKLCGSLSKGNTTMIFLNQIRMKVGSGVDAGPERCGTGDTVASSGGVPADASKTWVQI